MSVADVQERTAEWVEDFSGIACLMDKEERTWRLVEETFEYAQTQGVSREMLDKIRDHVYSRPVGEPTQELAGIGVCLLAAAESQSTDLESLLDAELTRVEAFDPEDFKARKARKRSAGISKY